MTAAWLSKHGYSSSLRSQYVEPGWLEQPARGVFHRPRTALIVAINNRLFQLTTGQRH